MKKLLILAALATATPSLAQTPPTTAISPLGPNSALLSLTAEGRSERTPDVAQFSAGVVTQGRTAAEAMAANSRQMDAVIAALRRAGIAERDIQTSAISLQPRYNNPERDPQPRGRIPEPMRIIGYEARNSVQIRVRRIGEMGRVIDALVSVGANEIHGPNFTLDDPKAAQDEARVEAVATGRQRAEIYARAAGMRVVRILSISEGGGHYPVDQIVVTGARMSAGAPPPPPTPVAPGEVSIGINLSMQFELAR